MSVAVESLTSRYEALRPHLSERQRRLWLGAEARELGPAGARVVAAAVGVAADTVRRGRAEIDEPSAPPVGRSRRPGAGRKRAEVHDPDLVTAFDALIDPDPREDPESPLRWTTKPIRVLAEALREGGHRVSESVVRRLLKEAGYSLQINAKTAEGGRHPDRDAQFAYLNEAVKKHLAVGCPVVSLDARKKERIGDFKHDGRPWAPAGRPTAVNVYDLIDPDAGKPTPYDVAARTGWVAVGTDHDTAAFAVATIAGWWDALGRASYPGADRLLITTDGGGSNGYRTRLWKTELAVLAADTGLAITVCQLPPGHSKWSRIEHRLSSHISKNWRAPPLTSHEVVVLETIAATAGAGLGACAELDVGPYPNGVMIPDMDMTTLATSSALTRHAFHGEWNYTLHPSPDSRPNRMTSFIG